MIRAPVSILRYAAAAFLLYAGSTRAMEFQTSTNQWTLEATDAIESVSFIIAEKIAADGRTFDDAFWLTSGEARLAGDFGNDVWLAASQVRLDGRFADHARVLAQKIVVDGLVSNGLWAVAGSITATTNAILYGQQLLFGDNLTLLGHIEGDVFARAGAITLGGTIVGDVRLHGDDIIVRPGTTIIGSLYYVTTNQAIVLDANSHVSGDMKRIEAAPLASVIAPEWSIYIELYWFAAALLAGIPFMLLFPALNGHAVRILRANLLRCGLAGLAFLILTPVLISAAAFSVIGIPLALLIGALYGILLYIGKFAAALAIGSTLLGRRGQLSVAGALLSLVTGLFLFYSMSLFPVVGSTLQTVAGAFGTGSILLAIGAGRGRIKEPETSRTEDTT